MDCINTDSGWDFIFKCLVSRAVDQGHKLSESPCNRAIKIQQWHTVNATRWHGHYKTHSLFIEPVSVDLSALL